ncbi:hypothetical protein V6N13_149645 [Hibiscus sabdariffa]|uniref:Uncharacterized protein n=2 Tax=Hibiscus sabdariffa TaxID=183260 RepID=A0ABR2EH71_9ROSI
MGACACKPKVLKDEDSAGPKPEPAKEESLRIAVNQQTAEEEVMEVEEVRQNSLRYLLDNDIPLCASIFNPMGLVFVAIVGSLLLPEKLHLGSSQMESVEPQVDCFDACSTGCPLTNTRERQRCEGKCRIRCGPGGPDSMADENLG